MNEEKRVYIKEWFRKDDDDLKVAELVLNIPSVITDIACFHCQQSVEKYLKAYLIYKDKDIEKTHDLSLLQEQCRIIDSEFNIIDLLDLKAYAVDIRYPDDALTPTLSEAKEYLKIAKEIKELVLSKINLT
jgi:HEPN domain-containing protein